MNRNYAFRDYILKKIDNGCNDKIELTKSNEFVRLSVIHFNPLEIAYSSLIIVGMIKEDDRKTYLTALGKKYVDKGYNEFLNNII